MRKSRSLTAIRAAGFLGLSLLVSGTVLAQEPVTIRFVQTNDIARMGPETGRGGFARLATGLTHSELPLVRGLDAVASAYASFGTSKSGR